MAISSVGTKLFMSINEHTDIDVAPAVGEMVEMSCSVTDNTITGGTTGQIDVTTLCDTVRRNIAGLIEAGTAALSVHYDSADDSAYMIAVAAYEDRKNRYFKLVLSDGSILRYVGYINSWNLTLALETAVTAEMGVQLDGGVKHGDVTP